MDYAKIINASMALWSATICHADFEWIDPFIRKMDFVCMDPPYHQAGDGYTSVGFSIDDQHRLESMCRRIDYRGAYFLQFNTDNPYIRNLYGGFHFITVPPRGSLRCDGTKKQPKGVVIITNYDPPIDATEAIQTAA